MQLAAVDGRRALVILPNGPDLVDILAANNVDISVSEGKQQGNLVSLLGNLIFPLLAFGGLFYLFHGNNGQVVSVSSDRPACCVLPPVKAAAADCCGRPASAGNSILPKGDPDLVDILAARCQQRGHQRV